MKVQWQLAKTMHITTYHGVAGRTSVNISILPLVLVYWDNGTSRIEWPNRVAQFKRTWKCTD